MASQEQRAVSKHNRNLRLGTIALASILFAIAFIDTPATQAQTFTVLHSFSGGLEGGRPEAGLTIDQAGNLYGTTYTGGHTGNECFSGCGIVFKLKPSGQDSLLSPLYRFAGGSDGGNPTARVVFGPDGSLYGTTTNGGGIPCGNDAGLGCGTVFNLKPKPTNCTSVPCLWINTVLYRFAGGIGDGADPLAEVVFDQAGNLYGTTAEGGNSSARCSYGDSSCGTVFQLARANGGWTESVLYSFTGGNDGGNPEAGLILDPAGNLYGTAYNGGSGNGGTVFELTPSGSGWTENVSVFIHRRGRRSIQSRGWLDLRSGRQPLWHHTLRRRMDILSGL
jgi:uncharacterized repeat protein (TIGR03803 family)